MEKSVWHLVTRSFEIKNAWSVAEWQVVRSAYGKEQAVAEMPSRQGTSNGKGLPQ